MLTLILTFLKEKLFSTAGIFIMLLVGILGIFLISNSEEILSRLGFETYSVVKTKLAKAEERLAEYENINRNLINQIEELKKERDNLSNSLTNYCKKIEETDSKVYFALNDHEQNTKNILSELSKQNKKNKPQVAKKSNSSPEKNNNTTSNLNKLSVENVSEDNSIEKELEIKLTSENIKLLHNVHSELFSF